MRADVQAATSPGETSIPASSTTSGSAVVLEAITGQPLAMASRAGSPKPSYRDGSAAEVGPPVERVERRLVDPAEAAHALTVQSGHRQPTGRARERERHLTVGAADVRDRGGQGVETFAWLDRADTEHERRLETDRRDPRVEQGVGFGRRHDDRHRRDVDAFGLEARSDELVPGELRDRDDGRGLAVRDRETATVELDASCE